MINDFIINIDNRTSHALLLHPLRTAVLKVTVTRDNKTIKLNIPSMIVNFLVFLQSNNSTPIPAKTPIRPPVDFAKNIAKGDNIINNKEQIKTA